MHSSNSAAILRSSFEFNEPIRISGLTPSAKALLLVKYVKSIQAKNKTLDVTRSQFGVCPLVVICPNDEQASELASDLECLAQNAVETSLNALHFPTWDSSPYSPIALSLRIRLARLATLSALAKSKSSVDLIVTSVPALCQATLPKTVFLTHSIFLEVERDHQSREDLLRQLVESGYLRVDPVEDPGTFAVRGDIVDVYPADRLRPVRIEFFGDVIERIREFDPGTQRASSGESASLKTLILPPAREVLINPSTSPTLRENLKTYADNLGIPRSVRDPILSSIRDGNYPDHSDAWAPFAYEAPATLMDYMTNHISEESPGSLGKSSESGSLTICPIIYDDELSCQQEWDSFTAEQQKLSEEAQKDERIVPPVPSLFPWTPEMEKAARESTQLFLDRLDLANLEAVNDAVDTELEQPPRTQFDKFEAESKAVEKEIAPSKKHRVVVYANRDLGRGSRHSLGELEPQFRLWIRRKFQILVLASTQSQLERIRFLLEEHELPCQRLGPGPGQNPHDNSSLQEGLISLKLGSISEGFRWPAEKLVVLTEGEILGTRHAKKQRKSSQSESGSAAKNWAGLQALSDLAVGDAVVHVDHGIGRYQGLVRLNLSGAPSDFLLLEYANKDKLYLPVYRLNVIQKYVGAGESATLDRLGSQQFAKTKEKVRDAVKRLAIDLIQLYAERKIRPGVPLSPRDAAFQEFEAQFPFDETPDQLKAIDAVLADLESGKVMDRLVCGDVGYGKTEVAIRAAFKAVSDGKQVAVLVPTTILAQQHEQSFKSRLKDYPLIIESVSRFKTAKEQRAILEAVSHGKVDIAIGTHRLLSKDVRFKDLGLVIVDEEHRFGVEHKERLKTLKINTHVLTLTATPIPRTLHMALSGLRDISLMNTPPVNRLPIRTYVSKYDEALLKRAIEFEISRGGQVFFLHNRVQSIQSTARKIRELVPTAQVLVAHGQMPEQELEDAMLSFYHKKANVLVCTTLIESGLDIPSANTMIINRADSLGLAQFYQIRGRVGRGQQRAYAYLFIPAEGALSEDAKRRLEVIQRFVELGSGFNIAAHDLEIRGGGDLLGAQQSGSIAAVGFDLYTELLEEAIREIQGKPQTPEDSCREPEIKTPFPAFLSEEYVPDVHQRLSLYRRFSGAVKDREVDSLEEELRDRFGDLPLEAQNLLWLIRVKLLLKRNGLEALTVGPEKVSILPGPQSKLNPVKAIALIAAHPHQYQLTPDSKLVAKIPTNSLRDLYFGLEKLLKEFTG